MQPESTKLKYRPVYTRAHDRLPGWAHRTFETATTVFEMNIQRWFFADWVNPKFSTCPEEYTVRFLTPAMIREFAEDPECDMNDAFLSEALSKGDECLGILDHDTLAAYSWYSATPTRIRPRGLMLLFDKRYVYMYKGFTRDRYRGQRLHAIGKTLALQEYLNRGFRGMISYVDYNNFNSLRSSRRMGARHIGDAYILGTFGHYLVYLSRGLREFGLRIKPLRPSLDGPRDEFSRNETE